MSSTDNDTIKLYIFYCSNNSEIDDFCRSFPEAEGEELKIISLPCSGKADLLYFVKAFETGADGLVLITCAKNECRHLEGNLRSPKRAEEVNSLLEEIGMGKDRIAVVTFNENGTGHIAEKIAVFRNTIKSQALNSASYRKKTAGVGVS